MWRIAPEPIIALDGDTAGLRAAMRVIDLALPLLEAGQSLRFAIMPDGLDPDDLIKAQGTAAMQTLLDGAMPMVQLLWQRETEGKNFDSPERKAALDKDSARKDQIDRDPSIAATTARRSKRCAGRCFRPKRRRCASQRATARRTQRRPGSANRTANRQSIAFGRRERRRGAPARGGDPGDLLCTPQSLLNLRPSSKRMECRDPTATCARDPCGMRAAPKTFMTQFARTWATGP